MNFKLIFAIALCFVFAVVSADNFAIIVAGSSGYSNYRHQADLNHAYQILKGRGVPDENIILFSYDDVANSPSAPAKYRGTLINKPGGENVYAGSARMDYKGNDNTPANFLKVMKGETMTVGSKKTLTSGPNDNVFVYFADHGAKGYICFPHGSLYANDLRDAVNTMYDKKMYKQLVVYIEACYSGSMGDVFPKGKDAYLVTAANNHQSSYACYWDSARNTYLGDLFSVSWMEDVESQPLPASETLKQQYEVDKARCTGSSENMQYGDVETFNDELIDLFMSGGNRAYKPAGNFPDPITDAVPVSDIELYTVMNRYADGNLPASAVHAEIERRRVIRQRFRSIMERAAGATIANALRYMKEFSPIDPESEQYQCYTAAVEAYEAIYGTMDYYTLSFTNALHELCGMKPARTIMAAIRA